MIPHGAFAQTPDFAPRTLEPRPTAFLKELPSPEVKIVQAGYLRRVSSDKHTFAQSVTNDYLLAQRMETLFEGQTFSAGSYCLVIKLKPDNAIPVVFTKLEEQSNGYYLIADLGKETVGYIHFRLNASLGAIVDIAHGEHLDDGRVRAANNGRNFTDRYICREGENDFLHTFRRIGARYVELHITNLSGPLSVQYVGVVPVELPLPRKGSLQHRRPLVFPSPHKLPPTRSNCACTSIMKIVRGGNRRSIRMIHGTRSFTPTICGEITILPPRPLDLLGRSYCGQGYLGIISPSKKPDMLAIPSFTMVWITELYEHFLHTGSLKLFEKFAPVVDDILDKALARKDPETSLYFNEKKDNIWNFYEWTENLSRQDIFPQSPYNLYLREALLSAGVHARKARQP